MGGGASSPLGPDSTWTQDSEMTGIKMEARIAQMEARILKEQEEKFNKMLEAITSIPQKGSSDTDTGDRDGKDVRERTESLIKLMAEMKEKVDLLLGGENEANKHH